MLWRIIHGKDSSTGQQMYTQVQYADERRDMTVNESVLLCVCYGYEQLYTAIYLQVRFLQLQNQLNRVKFK